jgi:signal transduction histidine kinase
LVDYDFYSVKEILEEILRGDDTLINELSDTLFMYKYLKTSSKALTRIRDLTSSMLNYSRISDNLVNTNLQETMDSCINILSSKIKSKKIKVDVDLDPNITINHISSDFFQVVLNIIGNAIDSFSDRCENRYIKIWSKTNKGQGCFHFENNGPKIEEKNIEKIFKKNFSTKGDRGNGIGLYICKQLVEKNGAKLSVDSNDKKTVFTVITNVS